MIETEAQNRRPMDLIKRETAQLLQQSNQRHNNGGYDQIVWLVPESWKRIDELDTVLTYARHDGAIRLSGYINNHYAEFLKTPKLSLKKKAPITMPMAEAQVPKRQVPRKQTPKKQSKPSNEQLALQKRIDHYQQNNSGGPRDRAQRMVKYAKHCLGNRADAWLQSLSPDLMNSSPLEASANSATSHIKAMQYLYRCM